MDLKDFNDQSQKFLAQVLPRFQFDLGDDTELTKFSDPAVIDDLAFETWFYNRLIGYIPHPELKEFPILFTFFVFRAPDEIKKSYLEETRKQRSGEAFNESVIGSYYTHIVPQKIQFENLTLSMKSVLEEHLYAGKGYEFARHVITMSSDSDFIVTFIEVGSVKKYLDYIKDKPELEFLPTFE